MHAIPAGLANKIGSERHAQANNKLLAMHLYGDIGARRRGQTGAETLDAARPSLPPVALHAECPAVSMATTAATTRDDGAPPPRRAVAAGHAVRILRHPFPDVGLGDGVECLSTAPAHDSWRVYRAVELVQTTHESLLREHRPDAIVSDVPFWWTTVVTAELGVPRLTFHPVGVFPQLAMNNLFKMRPDIIRFSSAPGTVVSVPGLPGKEITIPVSELPSFLVQGRPPLQVVGADKGVPARRLRRHRQHLHRP